MNRFTKQQYSATFILLILLYACSSSILPTYEHEVEIAPGKWITVTSALEVKERSNMKFEWNGNQVSWQGEEIPISIREHDDMLYMIGLDRSDTRKPLFAFFSLSDNLDTFERIRTTNYPKAISTQNMWLDPKDRFTLVGMKDEKIDKWEVLRSLDIESPYFGHSWTAKVWYQLENGTELHEMPAIIAESFLETFKSRYSPVPLPTIIQEPPVGSSEDLPNKAL